MDYADLLQGMDPATIQSMVDAGLIPQQMGLQQHQADIGNQMFQTPSAEGRNVGHTYVASSPLEHLSVAVQRAMGASKMQDAMRQQQALLQQSGKTQGAGWQQIVEAMRRRQAQQPQAAQPDVSMEAPVEQ